MNLYQPQTIHQYLSGTAGLDDIEKRLATVAFYSDMLMSNIREQYTSLVISHAGRMCCFFQGSKDRISTYKNLMCNRSSSSISFLIKTYLNQRSTFKHILYLVKNPIEPMQILSLPVAKLIDKSQRMHYLTFTGAHLLEGQRHCQLDFKRQKILFSRKWIELVQNFINQQAMIIQFQLTWNK
ncbi:Hypothetical_protein [Hexamita inflata]|uniref:Hypothetical_protein n=1 Tax=Hexamita inflata TaxID=28002 RepID=A0AA86RBK4_9EUKA|nr:Hypothetical protein HINF_LOCUS59278 [Hexamita inflata]